MGTFGCGAITALTLLMTFGVFAQESSNAPSGMAPDGLPGSLRAETAANPYSKALGPRIAGGVLCGLGAVNLLTGIICKTGKVFESMYADIDNDMRETGAVFDDIIWIEGAVMLGIAVPLVIVGQVKYGNWKKWEREHGGRVSLQGNSLVIEF